MRIISTTIMFLATLPMWASEPGQPLDCGDWVALEPGYTCVEFPPTLQPETLRPLDSEGHVLSVVRGILPNEYCGTGELRPLYVIRRDYETNESIYLGYFRERCVGVDPDGYSQLLDRAVCAGTNDPDPLCTIVFDKEKGRLLLPLKSTCTYNASGEFTARCSVPGMERYWLAAIEGFATTFDIIQTYTPISGPISFTVPYMPEGFQYADWFDTYYGDLATVGDWSQAQPLQCGYPVMAPSIGDYLTVEDTLPAPAAGQGYYYVTVVNYQGQRRYGRQANGGVLSGRDPTVLPECTDVIDKQEP